MLNPRIATATVNLLRIAASCASKAGVDPHVLLSSVGVDPNLLDSAQLRVPQRIEAAVWVAASRMTQDPAFGLHAAEMMEPGSLDVLDYAARCSATLGEGYAKIERYQNLITDMVKIKVIEQGPCTRVVHQVLDGIGPSRCEADFAIAAMVICGRQATGLDWSPELVCFRHSPPASARDYHRTLQVADHVRRSGKRAGPAHVSARHADASS